MKTQLCDICHEKPAMLFITRLVNGKPEPQALCLSCAMKLNLPEINQVLKQTGMTPEMISELSDDYSDMLEAMGEMNEDDDGEGEEEDEEDVEYGRQQAMPFNPQMLQKMSQNIMNLFNSQKNDRDSDETKKPNDSKSEKEDKKAKKKEKKEKRDRKYLNLYCSNLNQKVIDGKIDLIVGRDTEISRVIQILCRRTKNNPCLIGEPGVGKTAVAEGIAQRIVAHNVPAQIEDKEIFLLDMTALVAGTQFRGQFESRIKNLIKEVEKDGNIILFIDEIHSLVGAGGSEDSMSAANILKPALSRGEVQVIGATTFNEYRKYIEKDAALERRFQSVKIEEPSIEDSVKMLLGIKKYYENFHSVRISDELIRKTVTYAERYITDRFLPDKAIDLLDEACTCANLRNKSIAELAKAKQKVEELKSEEEQISSAQEVDYEELANVKSAIAKYEMSIPALTEEAAKNEVEDADLAKVIELWTGIPAYKVMESDVKKLLVLEDSLKAKIIGQDEACHAVANAIKRNRMNVSAIRRPASFIFVGPTGVGKTELVKQLANILFDTPETLVRLDMSEFMEKFSVSRIIGSPPGYVGYDEAGQLTEKIRRKPYSVVLFDEIEKAHPDVMNILLQILDEGRITDAQGRTVNFENTVIVMTSNAGSQFKKGVIGFGKDSNEATKEKVMNALSEFLRPEFLGRVDEVIPFNSLTKDDMKKIAVLLLDELVAHIAEKNIKLTYDEDVPSHIASSAKVERSGARELRTVIREEIEDKLAELLIENVDSPLLQIHIGVKDGKLSFSTI